MKTSPASTKISARFVLNRETKGAYRYQEINGDGQPLGMIEAKIGTLYIRKTAFEHGIEAPKRLRVKVTARTKRNPSKWKKRRQQ